MAGFTPQPDEGYSEDPLTAVAAAAYFSPKSREDGVAALGSARSTDEFPPWLLQHISRLSMERKSELAMALLNDLPTSVISQIVENLYPRLYIDFARYLPPEVCLKILGYLDPVSLINVARCCRAWYNLALDRKLWEQLYYLEGWKAVPDEIAAAENEMNGPSMSTHGVLRRMQSQEDGHLHKKRAISRSPTLDPDADTVMVDAGAAGRQESAEVDLQDDSIFGGPQRSAAQGGIPHGLSDSEAPGERRGQSKGKAVDKGKGRAVSVGFTEPSQTIDASRAAMRSRLWAWDGSSARYRINWKYLYTMRRRLEANWERGKYVNFQFPHPDHPEEGHGECVYSLQFNAQYLVSGSRDRTLKVWDMKTRRCLRTLAKHRGSVLCLQFDSDPEEDLIVSGSSDSDVIIWKFSTGKPIQTLRHAHRESVLNVRFDKRILVTCSKDKTIKVFNRRPLRHGDLGYQEVDPVSRTVKDYGYSMNISPDDFPEIPAWTMIGCLEGHNAAVNAVQIHDREVVSASGDRYIKVWDWPTQVCSRTIVGHNKGIACVQYDGRRIVSGSSDNEVKVFDRETGLEVANLRAHSSLVRTVQAGFGDLPYSLEDDLAEAKKVDQAYFKALESGLLQERSRPTRSSRRPGNAGSRRPEDICAYGAKLPPGGGGGKYGRIVSGSYDASIIIWRRDKDGVWKDQHHFKQETAAFQALQQDRAQSLIFRDRSNLTLGHHRRQPESRVRDGLAAGSTAAAHAASRSQTASAPPGSTTGPTMPPSTALATELSQPEALAASLQRLSPVMDSAVQGGPQALAQAITAHPTILAHRNYVEAAIDRHHNPVVRSQLRQTFSTALTRAQFEQGRQRREAQRNQEAAAAGPSTATGQASSSSQAAGQAAMPQQLTPDQLAAAAAHQAHAHVPHGAAPMHQVLTPVPVLAPTAAAAGAGAPAAAASAAIPSAAAVGTHTPAPTPVAFLLSSSSSSASSSSTSSSSYIFSSAAAQPQAQAQAQTQPLQSQSQSQQHPQQHPHPHIAQQAPPTTAASAGAAAGASASASAASAAAAAAAVAAAHAVSLEVHDPANPARVFKLQYDARRIVCCSQRSVIVGWDFCDGDGELEEASRFFGHIE